MSKQTQRIETAIRVLLDNFSDPVKYENREGKTLVWNRLGFAQYKVLGGLCYNVWNGIDYNENVRMARLKDQWEAFSRKDAKTEIDKNEMTEILRKSEECKDQTYSLTEMQTILAKLHRDYTGKDYEFKATPKTKAGNLAPDDKDIASMEATAKALFG